MTGTIFFKLQVGVSLEAAVFTLNTSKAAMLFFPLYVWKIAALLGELHLLTVGEWRSVNLMVQKDFVVCFSSIGIHTVVLLLLQPVPSCFVFFWGGVEPEGSKC